MDTPSFAELLRQHRLGLGLSQEELAERAGMSARGVQDLERGLNYAPRASTLRLLVCGLRLSDSDAAAL
jgi:transcriptional regulator with XRE-family HTH domain